MIDPIAAGLDALAHHDVARLPVIFLAGVVTSVGPCVAPRFVAVAAILEGSRRRALMLAAFVAGLLIAYAALGFAIGLLGALSTYASAVDALLAAGLCTCGIVVLARGPHGHPVRHRTTRASGPFVLGAASALIVSPCCTPIVAAVAGMSAFDRNPAVSAAFLAAFAAGHALPLVLFGASGAWVSGRFARAFDGGAAAVISGTLMLALGAYYGFLA